VFDIWLFLFSWYWFQLFLVCIMFSHLWDVSLTKKIKSVFFPQGKSASNLEGIIFLILDNFNKRFWHTATKNRDFCSTGQQKYHPKRRGKDDIGRGKKTKIVYFLMEKDWFQNREFEPAKMSSLRKSCWTDENHFFPLEFIQDCLK